MSKIFVLLGFVICLVCATPAFAAYTIDGDISDWGATPFTNWASGGTSDYLEEDDVNFAPSDPFQERWDIEAMYFDDDADYLYFAVVSSNAYSSHWARETLGFDLDGDGFYEYGAAIANTPVGGTTQKGFYSVNYWDTYRGVPYSIMNHGTMGPGQATQIGTYDLANANAGEIELDEAGNALNPRTTYILEGRISRLLFGDIPCGTDIRLHFARVTCVKDYMILKGTCDGACDVIPEPTTMLLLGSGLLGLGGMRLRRKRKK